MQKKKTCLITGATSGIGAAVAEALAPLGVHVVLVGRDRLKCLAAVERIRRTTPDATADYLVADLSIRSDVQEVARAFKVRYQRLDILINNAAAVFLKRQETVDGIEQTFALNHLAYFQLTNLLLDRLIVSAPSRIVNVASSGHMLGEIEFADLQRSRGYRGFPAYHQSKLANIMFTYELAKRLQGTGVTVNAVHPGIVATNIGRNNGWLWRIGKPLVDRWYGLQYVSPGEGARGIVYLATSEQVAGVTGKYFVGMEEAVSSPASHDAAAGRRLWRACEELVGPVTVANNIQASDSVCTGRVPSR